MRKRQPVSSLCYWATIAARRKISITASGHVTITSCGTPWASSSQSAKYFLEKIVFVEFGLPEVMSFNRIQFASLVHGKEATGLNRTQLVH